MVPAGFFQPPLPQKVHWADASTLRLDVYLNVCLTLVIALNVGLAVMTGLQDPGLAHVVQRVLLVSSLVTVAMIAGGLVGMLLLARAGKRSAQILSIAWTPLVS